MLCGCAQPRTRAKDVCNRREKSKQQHIDNFRPFLYGDTQKQADTCIMNRPRDSLTLCDRVVSLEPNTVQLWQLVSVGGNKHK